MKKLVKLAVATAVVFGASSAMAEAPAPVCGNTALLPGLVNIDGTQIFEEGYEGTLGNTCCVYIVDGEGVELVDGIVKDAYKTPIYAVDADPEVDDPIEMEKTIKCALAKKPKVTGPRAKGDQEAVTIAYDGITTCVAPKMIHEEVEEVEEVLAVEDDPDTLEDETVAYVAPVAYSPAVLGKIQDTDDWKNNISASGEVSLVCTQTGDMSGDGGGDDHDHTEEAQ